MALTTQLRQVWRTLNDGNGDVKVLSLQQWYEAEGWEHPDIVTNGGYWEDVPVSSTEPEQGV
jgi:hypothetical protein